MKPSHRQGRRVEAKIPYPRWQPDWLIGYYRRLATDSNSRIEVKLCRAACGGLSSRGMAASRRVHPGQELSHRVGGVMRTRRAHEVETVLGVWQLRVNHGGLRDSAHRGDELARFADRVALIDGDRSYLYADIDRLSTNLALNVLTEGFLHHKFLQEPDELPAAVTVGADPVVATVHRDRRHHRRV